ncbi:unnamed protein product [Caenorhabditis brenneri]
MLEIIISIVSVLALIFTVGLLFCGIPICFQVKRQGQVGDISGFPFITGILVSPFWLRYGMLQNDLLLITMNIAAFTFMLSYTLFFLHYSKPKKNYLTQILIVFITVSAMVAWVQIKPDAMLLGMACTVLNFINFGAPLAGLRVVIRDREVSTLPFALISVQFMVTLLWFLYGGLVRDVFIMIPAATGMILSAIQLFLFIIFPRTKEDLSPLEKLAWWFTGRSRSQNLEESSEKSSSNTLSIASLKI